MLILSDFGLSQILPMLDEETGAEPRVVSASISDRYLLLVRDDSSIFVAGIDNNLELEEIEKEDDTILATKWLSGCLYEDTAHIFTLETTDKGSKPGESVLMFLLSGAGALHVSFNMPSLIASLTRYRCTHFRTFRSLSM